jgi:hypothetical protein
LRYFRLDIISPQLFSFGSVPCPFASGVFEVILGVLVVGLFTEVVEDGLMNDKIHTQFLVWIIALKGLEDIAL